MTASIRVALMMSCLAAASIARAQQVSDSAFVPRIDVGTRNVGRGAVVMVDEAHHNFHTAGNRFSPFAALARSIGFAVEAGRARWDSTSLATAKVLVVANAVDSLHMAGKDWRLPAASAFGADEITAVRRWVERGGALLLIADHQPFAGAADSLAAAFGVTFANGFALPFDKAGTSPANGNITFTRANRTLGAHPITNGRRAPERVDSIVSFTGSAFWLDKSVAGAMPLLTLRQVRLLLPQVAWQFSDSTPQVRADGLLQGVAFTHGRGRVAVFGEAAMFSAQLAGPNRAPMGMNAPEARQNAQFVANVLRWLSGKL